MEEVHFYQVDVKSEKACLISNSIKTSVRLEMDITTS